MKIEWKYPEPKKGLAGSLDKFIGPGATKAELAIQIIIPIVALIVSVAYALTLPVDWGTAQYIICALLAADMAGGILTNATSTAKRWYHRNGQGFLDHYKFVVTHLCHLVLVSWLFLSFDIPWILYSGGFLLIASACILLSPIYLQRPISLAFYGLALIMSLYLLPSPVGLEWFLPLFYLKLLVSHLPYEEPYRPSEESC
ncbi:hypothetical protein [Photobacterium nomapromontoriensis]|uniref:hypothetical protein n=1 Tax=Photobacterium nomapromontoriensis TaxID=2910237 RepID=UPI003D10C850